MAKFCPKCGNKVKTNDIYCPECGTTLPNNEDKSIKHTMIKQIHSEKNNEPKTNNKRNKIIIISITIIIILAICLGSFYAIQMNQAKTLTVDDLQLNMTGYDYESIGNSSVNSEGIKGHTNMYKVKGHDDEFDLTVIVTDDVYNIGNTGEFNVTLNGNLHAVAITKYINGKYYWIQISNSNDNHNTQEYLESIILTKGTNAPTDTSSSSGTTSTSTNTGSTNDSSTSSSHAGKIKTRYCTTHGRVAVVDGTRCPYCIEEGLDSRTVKGSTQWI